MNAERFIKNNPFPTDGAERNIQIVADIQNPALSASKQENIELLFTINARLIWLVYSQYNYGESIDSVMSFMYEGIRKASESYLLDSGVPFYIYAISITRSLLQTYRAYHNSIIHIPLKQRDSITYEYTDINEYMDLEDNILGDIDELDSITELYELMDKYSHTVTLSEHTEYGFNILSMMRTKSMYEICNALNIGDDKYRDYVKSTVNKLIQFRKYGKCQHLTK